MPPIPDLADSPYLTNETIFAPTERPRHLLIIGAGPIGMEKAQAPRRLGAAVTVVDAGTALGREDRDLAQAVGDRFARDGVTLRQNMAVTRVATGTDGQVAVTMTDGAGADETITGSHLLVATGRAPTVDGLDLERAGIAFDTRGIKVDRRLRTTNKRVFAIGDCHGGYQFTHMAAYEGGIVIRNALFRMPAKADYGAVPRVTYTDPELAQAGLTEAEARARYGAGLKVHIFAYQDYDRAGAERRTEGHARLVTGRGGRILGVGVAGAQAGEVIQPLDPGHDGEADAETHDRQDRTLSDLGGGEQTPCGIVLYG